MNGDSHPHSHARSEVVRRCDVAIVGPEPAGIAAAEQLGRGDWSVIVVDDPATLAQRPPTDRERVRRHGVEVLTGRAVAMVRTDDEHLRVDLTGGTVLIARRVLLAGAVDLQTDDGGVPVEGDGATAAARIDAELSEPDEDEGVRRSSNAADWDDRYEDSQLWSGNPNGTLVAEVGDLAPGRALDVGAGEGADAIWLAEQGWSVVASDISRSALDRLAAEAGRRGLDVKCLRVDANEPGAFARDAYDLVSTFYPAVPRTADERCIANLIGSVAPGGTLLVVGHDPEPMRARIDTSTHSRAYDPDAFVRVEDVAMALTSGSEWAIEVHGRRARPGGSSTDDLHTHDIVLRARRADR